VCVCMCVCVCECVCVSFENLANFKYLGTARKKKQNTANEEIKKRLNSEDA